MDHKNHPVTALLPWAGTPLQVTQSLIQPEHCQIWGIYNLPGEPVPVSHHPYKEKFLPNM